jgi:hypothetical protein
VSRYPGWSLLVLVLVGGLVVGGAPGVLAQDQTDLDRIAAGTAAVRELPLKHEVVEKLLTQEELAKQVPEMIREDYPTDQAVADSRAWAAFGLVPEGTDLQALYGKLLAEEVAGYYDPETDEMYVISGGTFGPLEEYTYSHEMVHALQDQDLGLSEIIDAVASRSDDGSLALTSLYEGDAMAGSIAYVLANPALAVQIVLAPGTETPLLETAPPVMTIWFLFPYVGGQPFVEALRAAGGWDAVDAAYKDPPVSTEQIMHPEKYIERDDPTTVKLPDLGRTLGAGWSVVDENTVGELQTAVLLANLKPGQGLNMTMGTLELPEPAMNAAAGWDGDQYALWGKGDQEVLAWQSVWDSEQDAVAFSRALAGYDESRFGGQYVGTTADAVRLTTTGHVARIERSGTEVRYVLAANGTLADQVMGVLGG